MYICEMFHKVHVCGNKTLEMDDVTFVRINKFLPGHAVD